MFSAAHRPPLYMPDPTAPALDSMHNLTLQAPTQPDDSDLANPPPSPPLSDASTSNSSRASHNTNINPNINLANPPGKVRQPRRTLATLAKEKTSSALAGLVSIGGTSTPSLRSADSSTSLGPRLSRTFDSPADTSAIVASQELPRPQSEPRPAAAAAIRNREQKLQSANLERSSTRRTTPNRQNEMHQTSSRLLRMTDDDRPFTKDFKDLFSTLVVSLPLTPHRVRFTRVDNTFTSEEAVNNLGSLKFTQSNRMPDPKNPSRIVTTTTTTTFSMAKEMARSVCQRFLDARFIEAADSRPVSTFTLKGDIWQLTPKGIAILHRFCLRNGINSRHIESLLRRQQMQLVVLERDTVSDKLSQDKGTIEVLFRRFAGQNGPNLKTNTEKADSDSLTDYETGILGVKMAKERKIHDKTLANSFTGKAATDWLMDCTTTIDRSEASMIAESFVKWRLMHSLVADKIYIKHTPTAAAFQPTKASIYTITDRGQKLCGWLERDPSFSSNDSRDLKDVVRGPKDSNNTRLNTILQDNALRLLFSEFLRQSLCEENLSFYLDVRDFTDHYHRTEKDGKFSKPSAVRETLAGAYGLYNSFLASGAPSELNIEHSLRNRLDSRMTRPVGDDESMLESLRDVISLFEAAQASVYKLMANDSVPKFVRDARYSSVLREHESELGMATNRAFSPGLAKLPDRTANNPAIPAP